jgi:hypothetical protein
MTTQSPRSGTMSGGRIVLLVVGCLLALVGLGLAVGGGGLLWAHSSLRDDDGYFTSDPETYRTAGYAITSAEVDLGADPDDAGWADDLGDLARVRVTASRPTGAGDLFVGIGPRADVEAYLRGVPHSEVREVELDPFRVDYEEVAGARTPAPPGDQGFWVARGTGAGAQSLEWDVRGGRWTLVVMDARAARGVVADVGLGIRIDVLLPVAIGLLVAGGVLLIGGTIMIVLGARGRRAGPDGTPPAAAAGAATGDGDAPATTTPGGGAP